MLKFLSLCNFLVLHDCCSFVMMPFQFMNLLLLASQLLYKKDLVEMLCIGSMVF